MRCPSGTGYTILPPFRIRQGPWRRLRRRTSSRTTAHPLLGHLGRPAIQPSDEGRVDVPDWPPSQLTLSGSYLGCDYRVDDGVMAIPCRRRSLHGVTVVLVAVGRRRSHVLRRLVVAVEVVHLDVDSHPSVGAVVAHRHRRHHRRRSHDVACVLVVDAPLGVGVVGARSADSSGVSASVVELQSTVGVPLGPSLVDVAPLVLLPMGRGPPRGPQLVCPRGVARVRGVDGLPDHPLGGRGPPGRVPPGRGGPIGRRSIQWCPVVPHIAAGPLHVGPPVHCRHRSRTDVGPVGVVAHELAGPLDLVGQEQLLIEKRRLERFCLKVLDK